MHKQIIYLFLVFFISACSGSDDVNYYNKGFDAEDTKNNRSNQNSNPKNKSNQSDTLNSAPKPDFVPFDEDNHNVKWI